MAMKQRPQSGQQSKHPRQGSAQPRNGRPRSGNTGTAQKKKNASAPQQNPKAKRTNREAAAEAATPGNILWRLALILCVGLVVFSLLFASINGGAKYVGITYETESENVTPTPPVSSVDPNVNITGSDITPLPPSPTPDAAQNQDGGTIINGQPVTP